jgi:hypothetical protein
MAKTAKKASKLEKSLKFLSLPRSSLFFEMSEKRLARIGSQIYK